MYVPNNAKHRVNSQSLPKPFRWRKNSSHHVNLKSIVDWLRQNREVIFKYTLQSMVYSAILLAIVHVYTGGWEIWGFLIEYVSPIFSEVM
jgi:hypothetical protein